MYPKFMSGVGLSRNIGREWPTTNSWNEGEGEDLKNLNINHFKQIILLELGFEPSCVFQT